MKPLLQEIEEILTPNNSIGMVEESQLYQLQPLIPLGHLIEMGEQMDQTGQKKIIDFLKSKDTVIFNNIVYVKTRGLNFKGRLQEIITVYHDQLKQIIGEKRALIDLYDKIPVADIVNMIEDHVIFVMKKMAHGSNKALAAIRYLPEYQVYYDAKTFKFPGCLLAVFIDDTLALDNPEVIVDGYNYEHPFVFRDIYKFGQKICMGSFYNSNDKVQFNQLRFANNVNNLLKQAVQILVAGYNRGVTPANGHLDSAQYRRYLVKNNP